ncbi:MAG: glycoside hydrolase family 38 C-terminal domain-containing protein [Roseiarcus sp.]|jgi:alpha-mannosidase
MPLRFDQRLARLKTRLRELAYWRARQTVDVDGWRFDGERIALGAPWPRSEGVARFEASAAIPESWPLEEARLALNLGGESLLSLGYESGQTAAFGLDPYHQEFPLAERRFAILAESVARRPFGEPVRDPHLQRATLVRLDLAVCRLSQLLNLVIDAAETLRAHEAAPHLVEAAEAALRALDWPSATPDYIARIAPSPQQQTIWRRPEPIADPAPLSESERASVEAATEALTATLRSLQRRFPAQGEVALTGHAHIDLAWLWPYDETRRKLRRTFHTALSLMRRSPEFRFNQSSAHFYAQIEEDDPKLFAEIRARVTAGQWETIGGMWVEPDTNMPCGESLARQILYGQRYFERAFGVRHRVCWLPDCFGFSPALPQLMRQGGIDSFLTIKVNWSETNRFPHDLFWWEGLDGARVLAHTFDNPIGGYNGEVRPGSIAPTWANFRAKTRHPETLLAVGYGDGGGGPTPEWIDAEVSLRDFPALPRARWSRVDDFFARAHETAAAQALPTWRGEIYLELHRATLTTQSGVKRKHRRAESALVTAETAASLAHLLGAPAPQSLEPQWRTLMKNEFHDILPGSSIREVYEDAEADLDTVVAVGLAEQKRSLAGIAERLPPGEVADALVVVNPSLSERPLRVTLADGAQFATADRVPPLAVRVIDRAALAPLPGLEVGERRLENAYLRVELGEDGTIASLVHKPTGREALSGRGNQLWVYPQDKPRAWDAWDIEEDYAERGEELSALERLVVHENSAHRASLRVTRRWRHSRIVQTLALAANGRRLDIETWIDWRDRRTLLRALTPAAVHAERATFECAFGVVTRPTHANTSWDEAQFEVCAHRFVDVSEPGFGLALINDAKYGHSARDNVLGLSLVRAPVYPDPLADEGEQRFTYALTPHAGQWHEGGVREEAEDLNQPLLATPARDLAPGVVAPLAFEGSSAGLGALKPAEDGDGLILRVYEPAGARGPFAFRLPPGWRDAGAVDILEEASEAKAAHGLTPFEIRSWRLARA